MHKIKKKTGFTLAEVLITLLIIGIVSSIVIPALINETRNAEMQTAAKKALAVANQSYKLAVNDNGGGFGPYYSGNTDHAIPKFNALKSRLNIIKECPYNSNALGNCWADFGVGEKGYLASGCSRWSNTGNNQNSNSSFVTSDGMFWMLYSYTPPYASDDLAIDVNGKKGPNDWGKDVFAFKLGDTNIIPFNTGSCNLHHNDTTPVTVSDFLTPFK